MEVQVPFQYEREEDEIMGMDLQPRIRSHSQHTKVDTVNLTYSDDDGNITSEFSESTFEYSTEIKTNGAFIDGEFPNNIIEGRSVNGEAETEAEVAKKETFEEPNNNEENGINVSEKEIEALFSKDEGTNGYTVQQNGGGVSYSLPESDAGDKEMDIGSNGFSKSPDTAVGFKFVESLLDRSSSSILSSPPEITSAEHNIVNGIRITESVVNGITGSIVNGITESNQNEPAPEVDEYDVEGVLQKQETHDLYCPNCSSCITKRVILRRRKRKIQEISTGGEGFSLKPGQTPPAAPNGDSDIIAEESVVEPSQVPEAPDAPVDALTCFSCFSIFIPSGDGFLFWKWKPKTPLKPDGTSTEPSQDLAPPVDEPSLPEEVETHEAETMIDHGRGKVFPMWILTCCQPSSRDEKETNRPVTGEKVSEPESKPLQTSGEKVSEPESKPLQTSGETVSEPESKPPQTSGPNVPVREREPPLPPSDETPIPPKSVPPTASDVSLPPEPIIQIEITPDGGMPPPIKPVPPITPDDDTPISTEAKPPTKPDTVASVVVPMPGEVPEHTHLSVIPPDEILPETRPDIERPLIEPANQRPRPGVSPLDIIKAIVYGGLLESITSLSVISSAAGGDATTLNIVALGLANVFGGLVVLIHHLRILKNEHVTEHYQDQLGRPGHFLLHATVAVISYLVFGMMPPIIYGFSFRESDDKNLKLATLAAVSLVCIMILSIGKAYVRRPPKGYIKTIFYYISIGVMVSGLGYVAGELINELLKKLGVFDSRAPVTVPALRAGAVKEAWSSY